MPGFMAFLLSPARDALHNPVSLVVIGLAVLLLGEREAVRAWRGNRPLQWPASGAVTVALVAAVALIVVIRFVELVG
jgi:hypothetical protein